MAKYAPPGVTEIAFVTTASDYTTITASEANAGVDITAFVRNMPTLPRPLNTVDVSTLASKTDFQQVGTRGGGIVDVEILRDSAADTAYTTLVEDTAGYLVVARQGLATPGTFAVADKVDVWPVTVGAVEDGTPGRNDPDHAIAHMVVTNEPVRNYAIAT